MVYVICDKSLSRKRGKKDKKTKKKKNAAEQAKAPELVYTYEVEHLSGEGSLPLRENGRTNLQPCNIHV